jgi:AcrR family transcriptional regulator
MRGRILDESAALFLRRGYNATSLREIADAVGMKAGSLYYHFASKEDLLVEILQRGMDVMEAAFDEAVAAGLDGRDRIRAHVRAHLSALFEYGPYTANHVTAFHTAPDSVRERIVPARDAYEARWTELLAELQRDGRLRADLDIGLARLVLFGAMNASVEWFHPERGGLDTFADTITELFWSGAGR